MSLLAWLTLPLSFALHPVGGARPVPIVPALPSVAFDTVPFDTIRAGPGGYTGIKSWYRVTARIVGDTIADPTDPLVQVSAVAKDSPAERAGLAVGDLILEIDGASVRTDDVLARLAPGSRYTLRIQRGHDELEVTLVPGPPQAATPPRTP